MQLDELIFISWLKVLRILAQQNNDTFCERFHFFDVNYNEKACVPTENNGPVAILDIM